ncbi:MAG TPA: GTP-binding protein [Patescibacteria group bacterium]|nr:GTP-binding protein [Patescibacteria group bacterium]
MSQIYKIASKTLPEKHIVCIGHLDHGKSTLLGRLFYDLGKIDKEVMKRVKKYARAFGHDKFDFAYLMDQMKEERARGITIDLGHKKLETKDTSITFGDAPGHHDFLRNMLVGAAESDAAILLVAVDEGIQRQTEEHLFLAKMIGLPQVIIAINKMDLVDYQKAPFEKVKKQVTTLLKKVGYFPEEIPMIPTSALKGENIAKKSKKMKWFKGPFILEAVEKLSSKKVPSDLPMRLPVQDIYMIDRKPVIIGRLLSGVLKEKDEVLVFPKKKRFEVEKLFIHNQPIKKAMPGDNLYLELKGLKKGLVKRGDLITFAKEPPVSAKKFKAQIITFGLEKNLKKNFKFNLDLNVQETPAVVQKVIRKIDTTSGATVKGRELGDNEAGEVIITTKKPVFIETQNSLPFLANFRLKLKEKVVGLGFCLEIL